jgi:hypothetical protein
MSKVKEAIKTALEQVNNASHNTYGAKIYTFDQVAMILQDIMATADEDEDIAGGTVTSTDMYELVEALEERICDNIDGISESDIVDSDSLEASISGTRVSVDKDLIVNEAQANLDDTVREWLYKHKILIED